MTKRQAVYKYWLALLCVIVVAGCTGTGRGLCNIDCCCDTPAGAIPKQAGSKLCQWQHAQVGGAFADQFVLYQSDFEGRSTQLAPSAIERIGRLVHTGSANQNPWLIEPSTDSNLDQARVESVSYHLDSLGAAALDVVVATPAAIGLSGPLAERAVRGFEQNRAGSNTGRSGSSALGRSF